MKSQALGCLGRLLPTLFLFLACHTAQASDFTINKIETHLSQQVYVMDAQVNYHFSKRSLDALSSGVPLTLQMDIEVQRKRSWLPDETIATLEQRYRLNYHALSHSYLVRNLNSGALYVFPTKEGAIDSLSDIRNFPLLDANLISQEERYEVEVRIRLDIDELPSPLKLIAYVTPAWHLSSDWTAWSLQP